jgi:hypothetical protein
MGGSGGEALLKPVNGLQYLFSLAAVPVAIVAFVCAVIWADNKNTDDKFLGGLNW